MVNPYGAFSVLGTVWSALHILTHFIVMTIL